MPELEYKEVNGYRLPKVDLSDLQIDIGRYGAMRRKYLQDMCPIEFESLQATGEMNKILADFNSEAQERVQNLVEQMAKRQKDLMPSKNQTLEWVGYMNSLKNRAEKIVAAEMIYTG